MNKKLYIQPDVDIRTLAPLIMQKASVQYGDNPSTPIGNEDGEEDDFGAKDRNPWKNDLW